MKKKPTAAKRPRQSAPRAKARRPRPASRLDSGLLAEIVNQNPVAVMIADPQGRIVYCNPQFTRLTCIAANEVTGRRVHKLAADARHELFALMASAYANGAAIRKEIQTCIMGTDSFWGFAVVQPLLDKNGRVARVVAYIEDTTTCKQFEQQAEHMAFYDSLTDLPNRILFNSKLKLELQQAQLNHAKLALILMDLDRFKTINDTLGHTVGDQLIQLVGQRMQTALQEAATVARMGGDEFVVLLPHVASFQSTFQQVQRLTELFQEPFHCAGHELHITTSMGIALFPEDGENSQTLLKNADAALYAAKNSGRSHFNFYTNRLNDTALERLGLENSLRHAVMEKQLRLVYQPQVSISTGQIMGVEALIRWEHPSQGRLSPDKFIPLAEETGLIVPMGKWILQEACRQAVVWQELHPGLRMAVNLSMRQFQEPELVETVLGICRETGLPPALLELELTESMLMDESKALLVLQWLSKKGISLAVDDFGTGYSSLSYLKLYPLQVLKIDRSFIRECMTNKDDSAIVNTITAIAHHLGMKVIAEGVETPEQLQMLRELKCDYFQGFLFAKPLEPEQLEKLLKDNPLKSREN